MKESRKYVRRRSNDYLQVTSRDSGQMLGRVLNMSPKGIMVMSPDSLEVGRSYQLCIGLPKGMFDSGHLEMAASCRWSRLERRSELWENGLEIEEISDDSRKLLQQVVLRLMSNDGGGLESSEAKSGEGRLKIEHVRPLRYR